MSCVLHCLCAELLGDLRFMRLGNFENRFFSQINLDCDGGARRRNGFQIFVHIAFYRFPAAFMFPCVY